MWRRNNSFATGFTLLEMLVAIAIFALLGIAANSVLQTVLKNDAVTKTFTEKLIAMQKSFAVISRDLSQMVARTPRLTESDRSQQIFQVGENVLESHSQGLIFYRTGWLNPEGILPRGTIQNVAYVHHEDKLERWFFPYPDPILGDEPKKTVLMTGVLSVKYAFFINDKWQENADGKTLPKAIAIELDIEGLGNIQRKFLLSQWSDIKNLKPDSESSKDEKSGSNIQEAEQVQQDDS